MFDRLKQEKLFIHSIIFLISGILSFTILNVLFPLAVYGSLSKIAVLGAGMACGVVLNYFLYDRFFRPVIPDLKTQWLGNGLIAFIATFLIISLSPDHLPYYPVEHEIKIETNSPNFGFSHAQKIIEDGPKLLIEPELFHFSGAWNHQDFNFHQGTETGVIEYKQIEYIRHHIIYDFAFIQSDVPTSATVTIDEEEYVVEIAAFPESSSSTVYGFEIIAPEKTSISRVWQWIVLTFPYLTILSVFITMFCGVSYILSRKEAFIIHAAQVFLFVVVVYLFWIAINFQNDVFNYLTQTLPLIITVFIAVVVIPVLLNLILKNKPQSIWTVLIAILLLGIGLRVYWIVMVPSAQVSDFGRFHNWALQIANHESGIYIDRYANFTRALSLLYRIFPSHVAVEVFNIFFSTGTSLCLYLIGKNNGRENAGVIAAYWMSIFVPQIAMTSIVNTDIPAVFFLVLSVLFVTVAIRKEMKWLLVIAGIAFAACMFIRGAMLTYFPVLFLMILLPAKQKRHSSLKYLGILLLSMIGTSFLFNQGIQFVGPDDMVLDESRYLIWPLINGVNIDHLGRNNAEDTAIVFQWTDEEVNQKGFKLVIDRIFSDPLRFYSILKDKYEYQFANAAYGVDLAFYDESHEFFDFQTGWNVDITTVRETYAQIAQHSYLILLILAVWSSLHTTSGNARFWIPAAAILFCAFAAYTFFEVQPRYSQPIIPFLMLLSALSFNEKKSAHQHELPS